MQDNKQSSAPGSQAPNIVKDIPVAVQAGVQPLNEDDELDKIMHDVGKGLRQDDQPKPKHHWFKRQKKAKSEPKLSAQPSESTRPMPVTPQPPRQATTQTTQLPAKGAPTKQAIKAGPVKTSQTPVRVVILAIVVACSLIAAAYFAYK
jgi:hypothetical protein